MHRRSPPAYFVFLAFLGLTCLLAQLPGLPAAAETESAPSTTEETTSGEPESLEQKQNGQSDSITETNAKEEEYFELLQLFADTIDQVERNYVQKISKRELVEAAIEGILSKLDPYSDYIPPESIDAFRTEVESEFGGIGIRVGMTNGKLFVVTPLYGTPAHKAGIVAGDEIVQIDDQKTDGLKLDAAIQLMKGKIGTPLQLLIRHKDGTTETVTLKREMIPLETVMGSRRRSDGTWDFLLDQDKKIGYVRISSFSRTTPDEVRAALKSLSQDGATGLILDLRFNPGGLLSAAVEIADMFLADGVIVGTRGRNVKEHTWEAKPNGEFEEIPMVVLVNQYSASASEIVSAALQDHGRALVVGTRTWGKGSVQNIVELEGGKSALKLTTASYTRPSGKNIHRFPKATESDEWGVKPNDGCVVEVPNDQIKQIVSWNYETEVIRSGDAPELKKPFTDRQLEKAIEKLRNSVAHLTRRK